MMSSKRRSFVALASLLWTTSCTGESGPKGLLYMFGPDTDAMPKCGVQNRPDKGDVKVVVRIVIPEKFDPASSGRNVRYKSPQADDAAEDDDDANEDGAPNTFPDSPKEPFHLDLRSIVKNNDDYAQVRVVLKDYRYVFFDGVDGNGKKIKGVGISPPKTMKLCGAHFSGPNARYPSAIFYVKMKKSGDPVAQSFNIGIVPTLFPDTPIFIDPKVINNG